MNSSKPPIDPGNLAAGLRSHFDVLESSLKVQSMRREHATERSQLRWSTDELRRWREQYRGLGAAVKRAK